jgi:hypothetical protein
MTKKTFLFFFFEGKEEEEDVVVAGIDGNINCVAVTIAVAYNRE